MLPNSMRGRLALALHEQLLSPAEQQLTLLREASRSRLEMLHAAVSRERVGTPAMLPPLR